MTFAEFRNSHLASVFRALKMQRHEKLHRKARDGREMVLVSGWRVNPKSPRRPPTGLGKRHSKSGAEQ